VCFCVRYIANLFQDVDSVIAEGLVRLDEVVFLDEAVHDDAVSRVADVEVREARDLEEFPCLFESEAHADGEHDNLVPGRVRLAAVEDLVCIVAVQIAPRDDLVFLQLLLAEQHVEVFRNGLELQLADFFLEEVSIAFLGLQNVCEFFCALYI